MGYNCSREVSRQVIREQLALKTNALPWLDTAKYCHLVFERMLNDCRANKYQGLTFFDRGIPDVMANLSAKGIAIPSNYYESLERFDYQKTVFILPPESSIYINDEERTESYEEAFFVYRHLIAIYEKLEFELKIIPLCPPEIRAEIILDLIK